MLGVYRYAASTVVILAGYKHEMHDMLRRNPGLKSRFQEYVHFDDWDADACVRLVERVMAEQSPRPFQWETREKVGCCEQLRNVFAELSRREPRSPGMPRDELMQAMLLSGGAFRGSELVRPGWANARDAHGMFNLICKHRDLRMSERLNVELGVGDALFIRESDVRAAAREFLAARPKRSMLGERMPAGASRISLPTRAAVQDECAPHHAHGSAKGHARRTAPPPLLRADTTETKDGDDSSDSDASCADEDQPHGGAGASVVSTLLQAGIDEARTVLVEGIVDLDDAYRQGLQRELEFRERELAEALEREAEAARLREELRALEEARQRARDEEEARQLAAQAEAARKRAEELARQQRLLRERVERAAKIRRALAAVGQCCQGFAWRREGSGFRCAGGSHTASFEQIAAQSGLSVSDVRGSPTMS